MTTNTETDTDTEAATESERAPPTDADLPAATAIALFKRRGVIAPGHAGTIAAWLAEHNGAEAER